MKNRFRIENVVEIAKVNLKKFGYLTPAIIAVLENGMVNAYALSFHNDDEKKAQYLAAGKFLKKINCVRAILINDIAVREVKKEDFEHVVKNFETERPTLYPESLRKDAIFIQDYDISNNHIDTYYQEYKVSEGKYVFGDLEKKELSNKSILINWVKEGMKLA